MWFTGNSFQENYTKTLNIYLILQTRFVISKQFNNPVTWAVTIPGQVMNNMISKLSSLKQNLLIFCTWVVLINSIVPSVCLVAVYIQEKRVLQRSLWGLSELWNSNLGHIIWNRIQLTCQEAIKENSVSLLMWIHPSRIRAHSSHKGGET